MIKVLNIITGGMLSDGITSSWLTFCKQIMQSEIKDKLCMDFTYIEEISDSSIRSKFSNIGITTIDLPSRQKYPIKYIISLFKLLRRNKYDVIHVSGSSHIMAIELIAGFLSRTPVRVAHSRNTTCNNKFLNTILKYPFDKLCNVRLACGEDAGRWLFKNNDFNILHNGKDLSEFAYSHSIRQEARNKYDLNNKIVIGHVGKFNDQKNHDFIIDIFTAFTKLVPNSILMLIGDGPLKDKIEQKVNQLGISSKVLFMGAVSDVPFRLHAADIMVLPSKYEGLPNVVLEWQALGLPCLISDNITDECAVSELVHFESFNNNASIWALNLYNLINETKDREEKSKISISLLKQAGFDIVDSVNILYNLYEHKLCESK